MRRLLADIPPTLDQKLRRCRNKIADLDLVLHGTLAAYYTTCGKDSCRCQNDQSARHGPYFQWTTKIDGKTRTVRLSPKLVPIYRSAIQNGRRLDKLLKTWTKLSRTALDKIRK